MSDVDLKSAVPSQDLERDSAGAAGVPDAVRGGRAAAAAGTGGAVVVRAGDKVKHGAEHRGGGE